MKSIIKQGDGCYLCGSTHALQTHHIYMGKNRNMADKHGLTVKLCLSCHTGANGVHFNRSKDLYLKRLCQAEYEKTHTREEFFRLIGRNYLD